MSPFQKRCAVALFAIGLGMAVLWLFLSMANRNQWPTRQSDPNGNPNSTQSRQNSENDLVKSVATNVKPIIGSVVSSVLPPKNKAEQIREGLALLNDQEIKFYGKVIDQNGQPLAFADVLGSIIIKNGATQGVKKIQTTTDAQGRFQFLNESGRDLAIVVKKNGYVVSTTNTVFIFSHIWPVDQRHTPDSKNPVVFKMWKLQGAEQLVKIDQNYRLAPSETKVFLDVLTGNHTQGGGDMKISVQRPSGIVSERNPQDWSLTIEAVDGGLIETSIAEIRTTFAAPDDSYVSSHHVAMVFNERTWAGSVQRNYFFKSRNGQVYSKLSFSLNINQNPEDPIVIRLRGIANAHGSKNWEEDPDKVKLPGSF